jgi:flagellar basal-body rod protein FlgC
MTDPRRLGLLPAAGVETPRPRFRSLSISASGLSAQRARMETIAQNIANADVTRTEAGGPYRRRTTILESATRQTAEGGQQPSTAGTLGSPVGTYGVAPFQLPAVGDVSRAIPIPLPQSSTDDGLYGVRVVGTEVDPNDAGRLVYEPGHPDADANGYVRYPDVDTTQEMVALLDAKRLYEANAAVFQSTKQMLRAALDI